MKEQLSYGYKTITFEDGTVKYYDITEKYAKRYKEITKKREKNVING